MINKLSLILSIIIMPYSFANKETHGGDTFLSKINLLRNHLVKNLNSVDLDSVEFKNIFNINKKEIISKLKSVKISIEDKDLYDFQGLYPRAAIANRKLQKITFSLPYFVKEKVSHKQIYTLLIHEVGHLIDSIHENFSHSDLDRFGIEITKKLPVLIQSDLDSQAKKEIKSKIFEKFEKDNDLARSLDSLNNHGVEFIIDFENRNILSFNESKLIIGSETKIDSWKKLLEEATSFFNESVLLERDLQVKRLYCKEENFEATLCLKRKEEVRHVLLKDFLEARFSKLMIDLSKDMIRSEKNNEVLSVGKNENIMTRVKNILAWKEVKKIFWGKLKLNIECHDQIGKCNLFFNNLMNRIESNESLKELVQSSLIYSYVYSNKYSSSWADYYNNIFFIGDTFIDENKTKYLPLFRESFQLQQSLASKIDFEKTDINCRFSSIKKCSDTLIKLDEFLNDEVNLEYFKDKNVITISVDTNLKNSEFILFSNIKNTNYNNLIIGSSFSSDTLFQKISQ